MIIRSGLIQNRSGVDPDAFDRHWREVHGPLAALLPNLRGYVQNHVTARLDTLADTSMHRIDGISQLWFDDVPSMVTGMDSPENEACVRDISGFLDNVTLFVQKPGLVGILGGQGLDPGRGSGGNPGLRQFLY